MGIDWHAEILKAKLFMLRADNMKYVSLAEQILAERDKYLTALRDIAGTDTGHKCKCECANNLICYAEEELGGC